LLMLLLYELLREALLRLPTALGSSVGIVGVLIIGDAAVAVGLISAPAVVVAALTYISSALVVGAYESIALLRIGLLALGAAFGLHGLLIGLFITLAHLCSLTSFGCPYMLPLAPVRLRALGDSLVRMRTKNLLKKDGM
ncbi:MAG: spore germination protein, partial [Christensenellaceae bacterium]|nr:spore germination protein [Christensenellaceae bacterium]